MNFKRRFTFMLSLGVSFSITLLMTQQSLLLGSLVAMVAVVLNYWLMLHFVRRTVLEMGSQAVKDEE